MKSAEAAKTPTMEEKFMEAAKGLTAFEAATILNKFSRGVNFIGCSKKHMSEVYADPGEHGRVPPGSVPALLDMLRTVERQNTPEKRMARRAKREAEEQKRRADSDRADKICDGFEKLNIPVRHWAGEVMLTLDVAESVLERLISG